VTTVASSTWGTSLSLAQLIPAGTSTDPAAVAKAILPGLIAGLGDHVVTDGDLAASLAPIAEALGKLPDEVRATLKAAL
jgi:ethanolamine ammonia-lyase large subunit